MKKLIILLFLLHCETTEQQVEPHLAAWPVEQKKEPPNYEAWPYAPIDNPYDHEETAHQQMLTRLKEHGYDKP
jgi:hypothetical protein